MSGAEMLERLAKRGVALNAQAQALAAACGTGGHKQLDDCFKGRRKKWPSVPAAAPAKSPRLLMTFRPRNYSLEKAFGACSFMYAL